MSTNDQEFKPVQYSDSQTQLRNSHNSYNSNHSYTNGNSLNYDAASTNKSIGSYTSAAMLANHFKYSPVPINQNEMSLMIEDTNTYSEYSNQQETPQDGKSLVYFYKISEVGLGKQLFHLTPTILGTILYLLTLKGCNLTQFECLEKYPIKVVQYLIYVIIIAALLYTIQILLFFYKYTDLKPVLIQLAIILITCFIYDTGTDLDSHGGYNRIILFLSMGIHMIILLLFINFGYFLCKKPLVTIFVIMLIVFLAYLRVNYVVKHSCEGWELGFKGSSIYNPKESLCKITPPKICYYKIFDGVFDLSRVLGDTCENMRTNKLSNMEKYLPDKTAKILGYPRTEHWDIFPARPMGKFRKEL